MNGIIKAGEHIRIVVTDEGYEDKLGDQTGLVGTVKRDSANNNSGVYVTFPHTGDKEFYYVRSEFKRAGTPAAEPFKTKYAVGDWVKVTGRGDRWDGQVGQVKNVPRSSDYAGGFYELKMVEKYQGSDVAGFKEAKLELTEKPTKFKLGDWVRVANYPTGSSWYNAIGEVVALPSDNDDCCYKIKSDRTSYRGIFNEDELVAAEKPAKFKAGDWAKVTGRKDKWDGRLVTITSGPDSSGYYLTKLDGKSGNENRAHFKGSKLEKTDDRPAPEFKAGDWVKVKNYAAGWDGVVGQVTRISEYSGAVVIGTQEHGTAGFAPKYLEATEEPHWAFTKPVGTTVQLNWNGGGPERVVTKVAKDKWLHLYQNGEGSVKQTAYRTDLQTSRLAIGKYEFVSPEKQ